MHLNTGYKNKAQCMMCGTGLHSCDEMYSWTEGKREGFVCEACFDTLVSELSRYELAALLGSEVVFNR